MLIIGFIGLCVWMLLATVLIIISTQKANMNEKRILAIDKYLQNRIKDEQN